MHKVITKFLKMTTFHVSKANTSEANLYYTIYYVFADEVSKVSCDLQDVNYAE